MLLFELARWFRFEMCESYLKNELQTADVLAYLARNKFERQMERPDESPDPLYFEWSMTSRLRQTLAVFVVLCD